MHDCHNTDEVFCFEQYCDWADFDAKLVSRLHMAMVQTMTDPSTIHEFGRPLSELQKELHTYHLRGIATDQGLEYLRQRNNTL